ncbi:hypothetical protein [Amycolatopsis vancoresmycina]|uniref:hypothetical protein n=1 Tax=Amycolatopsis vancoresmycina TaxID=208444 RepID=UPI000B13E5DE|nr:hypothetical protein [Amycolatopsis vancoresmycina]
MTRGGVLDLTAGTQYVFRGSGAIPDRAATGATDFRDVVVVPVPPETIVFGTVADPRRLPEILRRLEALGMHVVSVHRVRELPLVVQRASP